MRPRSEHHATHREGMGAGRGDQAHPAARMAAIPLLLIVAACDSIPRDVNPVIGIRNIFGAHLEGREPPPGLDRPYPNLASVPARPVPPDAATRGALNEALARDREASRTPLEPRAAPAGLVVPEGGPPPPPRLAAAPPLRASEPAPAQPAASPAAPTPVPEFRTPPPVPAPELLAPPPPAADLLAPRR